MTTGPSSQPIPPDPEIAAAEEKLGKARESTRKSHVADSLEGTATAREYEALKHDVEALRADLKSLAARLADLGSAAVDDAKSTGKAGYKSIRHELDHRIEDIESEARHQLGRIEGRVREKPLMSVLTAFGIGYVLARLTGGR